MDGGGPMLTVDLDSDVTCKPSHKPAWDAWERSHSSRFLELDTPECLVDILGAYVNDESCFHQNIRHARDEIYSHNLAWTKASVM